MRPTVFIVISTLLVTSLCATPSEDTEKLLRIFAHLGDDTLFIKDVYATIDILAKDGKISGADVPLMRNEITPTTYLRLEATYVSAKLDEEEINEI